MMQIQWLCVLHCGHPWFSLEILKIPRAYSDYYSNASHSSDIFK